MSADGGPSFTFRSPGPVASAFLQDRTHKVRALLGPVGGGKTVTNIFDALTKAAEMPVCRDGAIHFKLAIIGETYGQLERNLYPTWKKFLPEDGANWFKAEWEGGGGRAATHRIQFSIFRGGRKIQVHFEAVFAAIGEYRVEQFMRGFEPTAFWLFEVDLHPEEIIPQALLRLGRFPATADLPAGVEYYAYIACDLNAPDVESWFYRMFEENRPASFALYKQPSGRGPNAENLHNLPKTYYADKVEALAAAPDGANLIKRMVDAQYAPSRNGQPVYPEYSDDVHLAKQPLTAVKGVPIRIGLDAGLRGPAAVFGQWVASGQWRILGELVPGRCGPKTFARLVAQWLAENAPNNDVVAIYSDPYGFTGSDTESGLLSWSETMMAELQLPIMPAPSNEISVRLDAVRDELMRTIDGAMPAILISPACKKWLRKGFVSSYRYSKQRVAGNDTTSPTPVKDEFADPHDALQYLLLGSKGRHGVISGQSRRPGDRRAANTVLKHSWSPFG